MTKDLMTERLKLKDLYPERAEALAKEHKIDVEDLELVRKGVIAEKAEVDKDERAVTSYINTAIKDRDNEIIEPEGAILTHYRKNPVVPYGHDYRGLPVAKNIWIKKDKKGLLAKTVFLKHSLADDVYRLYSEDVAGTGPAMKGWSIGFIPLKWEESPEGKDKPPKEGEMDTRPRRTYKKWELVEYSAVMIPSNRDALTEMVEKGLIKSEKLKKDIGDILVEIVDEDPDMELGLLPEASLQIVDKIEETEEYIRIPARGQEGKHRGHKIRWITVSAKKGIRGIYCIDDKIIITYVFDKKKGWTLEKAKKWMKDHGKGIAEAINKWNEIEGLELNKDTEQLLEEQLEEMFDKMDGEVIELEDEDVKGVIPFKETGKAPEDEKWDGPREVREAEVSDLKIMATWFDLEKPDIKSSYKLPHHKAKGHAVVWRGVAAAMAALLGARGGTAIPGGDRKGCYGHLSKHYKQFDKEPPEFRKYTEEELEYINGGLEGQSLPKELIEKFDNSDLQKGWTDTIVAFIEAEDSIKEKPKQTDREKEITRELFDRMTEQLNKVEEELKSLKEGRVLSEKNRKLVKQCADMLNELYEATEPPQREEFELEIEGYPKADPKLRNPIEIDRDSLTKKIASIIKNRIEEMVQSAINKAKGKVE